VVELVARRKLLALFVERVADQSEILRRLKPRASRKDEVSDATPEVYLRQRREFTLLRDIASQNHLKVDTTAEPEMIAIEVERRLAQLVARSSIARSRA